MGLLSRLRAWLGGGSGAATEDEADDATDDDEPESGDPAPGDAASGDADDPTGLDPSAATETRTAANDDAVDALRDVRRSHETSASDGDAEDADEALPNDVDQRDRDAG